jgi:hypothetical protein
MSILSESPIRYLSKASAQDLWQDLIVKNQIPASSRTARCMFEETRSSRGKQCQFGLTPLWDNELRKNSSGEVLHSEFMDMAQRLIDSAKVRQKARR